MYFYFFTLRRMQNRFNSVSRCGGYSKNVSSLFVIISFQVIHHVICDLPKGR